MSPSVISNSSSTAVTAMRVFVTPFSICRVQRGSDAGVSLSGSKERFLRIGASSVCGMRTMRTMGPPDVSTVNLAGDRRHVAASKRVNVDKRLQTFERQTEARDLSESLVQRLSQAPGQLGDKARLDAGERTIRPRRRGRRALRRRVAAKDRRDERVDDAPIENQQQARVELRAVQHRRGQPFAARR